MKLFEESKLENAPESQVLSPDMGAVYQGKGSVPEEIQLLRKAVAEETKSISDYEGLVNSGKFSAEEVAHIQEIVRDEKDHIVKFTRMLCKRVEDFYKEYGED